MTLDLPPIFIIGVARSGTSILGKFFENNSQCRYFFEVDIWKKNEFFKPPKYERPYGKFLLTPLKRQKLLFTKIRVITFQLSQIFQNFHIIERDKGHQLTENDVSKEILDETKKIKNNIKNKRLVVKHPRNSLRIPFIKKLFPDAKFLHIVRDGRDTTCSLMGRHSSLYWAHVKPPGWQKIQKKYPKGPLKYAWQWNETINIIRKDKSLLNSEDFVEIKYEDFVDSPKKVMKEVFDKFGIPFEKPQEDYLKSSSVDVHFDHC